MNTLQMTENQTLRLFLAWWPEPAAMPTLIEAQHWLHQLVGGRPVRQDDLHLTLVFLGAVPASRLDELIACVDCIERPQLAHLQLDSFAIWPGADVGIWTCQQIPAALLDWVRRLREGFKQAGFAFDRKTFKPHITLLRRVTRSAQALPISQQVHLPFADLRLVQSGRAGSAATYYPLQIWR